MSKRVLCPYCRDWAHLVRGDRIYPSRADLADLWFYLCSPCDAYVGCHSDSTRPKGRLANAELRQARVDAHAAFDPLWKSGDMRRGDAYRWLAGQLGIPRKKCHIGNFDVARCRRVVEAAQRRSAWA